MLPATQQLQTDMGASPDSCMVQFHDIGNECRIQPTPLADPEHFHYSYEVKPPNQYSQDITYLCQKQFKFESNHRFVTRHFKYGEHVIVVGTLNPFSNGNK